MLTFKALSLLIDYPTRESRAALEEIPAVLESEALLGESERRQLLKLIEEQSAMSLIEAQQAYVELFDRGSKLSLHIFEHTHGESRDRGPAMVALMEQYRSSGLELTARELPDYLPLVLEFASLQPLEEGRALLAEAMPVLALLGARLEKRQSAYGAVFAALQAIGNVAEDTVALRERVAQEGPDEALVNIDKVWEEEAITFTEGSALSAGHTAGTTVQGSPARPQPVRWVSSGATGE